MFGTGEGAVSTGAMVPVFAATDATRASAVADLLEAHAIPAIVDAELAGQTGLSRGDTPRVYVPSTMLPAAKAILQKHEDGRSDSEVSALVTWVPAKVTSTALDIPVARPEPAPAPREARAEEFEGPLEAPLPEPGPVGPRLVVALTAIMFGLGLQRWLEMVLDERAVYAFGAHGDLLAAPWRLVTAGFMHGSPGHMISNAGFGLLIGVVLFGTHRIGATCMVWLLSSFAGLGAELWMSENVNVIGASAGNYGLVGLWAFGQLQRAKGVPLPRRERLRTIGVLLLLMPGAFTPFSSSGTKIAVVAHGIGFLAGFLLGAFFERRLEPEGHSRIATRSRVAGWIAVGITALGTTVALLDTVP